MKAKINYLGNEELIVLAVQKANFVLESDLFHHTLSAQKEFDHSDATGAAISNLIATTNVKAEVEVYKSVWPWSRVNGYTLPDGKNKIFLNGRKLDEKQDEVLVAATLIHEFIHLIDFENDAYSFGHVGNKNTGKDNTAPYWIGKLAEKILNKAHP